jgi:hypothetical protein
MQHMGRLWSLPWKEFALNTESLFGVFCDRTNGDKQEEYCDDDYGDDDDDDVVEYDDHFLRHMMARCCCADLNTNSSLVFVSAGNCFDEIFLTKRSQDNLMP